MGTLKLKKSSNRVMTPRKGGTDGPGVEDEAAPRTGTPSESLPSEPAEGEGHTMELAEFRAALEAQGVVLRPPFMVRIDKAIREATGIPWKQIERNLARLTNRRGYHQAVIESPVRYDLAGKPSGPVDPEHKDRARELLAKSRR